MTTDDQKLLDIEMPLLFEAIERTNPHAPADRDTAKIFYLAQIASALSRIAYAMDCAEDRARHAERGGSK